MPLLKMLTRKSVLSENRAWLMLAVVAAAAYIFIQDSALPDILLMLFEFLPFALLANYVLIHSRGAGSELLALMLAFEGAAAAFFDLYDYQGTIFAVVGFAIGIGLFLTHSRMEHASRLSLLVGGILFLAPVAFLLFTATSRGAGPGFQGIAIGGMVASAWLSTFSRERVFSGVLMVLIASMIAIHWPGHWLSWPMFFIGHLILAVGVTAELHAREV